jgi:hypothetical protein
MFCNPTPLLKTAVYSIVAAMAVALGGQAGAADDAKTARRLTAFCIDFNWAPGGPNGFALPGTYSQADPRVHYQWAKDLGTSVIYTFCVSCDGYAWYKASTVAPVEPGLKYDFLHDIAQLAHRDGKLAVGYFCAGANTYWGLKHPDQSYGTPSAVHIPYTREYLDYLAACIQDVLTKTEIDGFQVDWMYSPPMLMEEKQVRWMPCERQMYAELFGRPFPGKDKIDAAETLEFQRRALKRCWRRIHDAAKAAKPDCILWLTCFDLRHPQLAGTGILREVDWLVNEHPDPAFLDAVRKEAGPHTRLWQCLCGWGDQNRPQRIAADPKYADLCLMGFAAADPATTLPYTAKSSNPSFAANARNIETLRQVFHQVAR